MERAMVPFAARHAYVRCLEDQLRRLLDTDALKDPKATHCDTLALALALEQNIFVLSTRCIFALQHAERPRALLVAGADVSEDALSAYSAHMRRVIVFMVEHGTALLRALQEPVSSHAALDALVARARALEGQMQFTFPAHDMEEDKDEADAVVDAIRDADAALSTRRAENPDAVQDLCACLLALDEGSSGPLLEALGAWGGWTHELQARQHAALNALTEHRKDVRESIYACQLCGSTNVMAELKQIRSGDEGHAVLLSCNACGKASKIDT